jgi:tetratricopeptide (TPR) repeat protein
MTTKIKIIMLLLFLMAGSQSFAQGKHHRKNKKQLEEQELMQQKRYHEADLFARAITYKETGRLQQADSLLSLALKINPEDAAANYEKARLLSAYGKSKEALVLAKKAVQQDSTNKWYQVLFANLSKTNGDYKDYLNTYKKLCKEEPGNLNFQNELAFAYYFTGDYKHAVRSYRTVEMLMGVNPQLTKQIADLYLRLNEKDSALVQYEQLVKYNPENARAYAMMAEFASKNGLPKTAEWAYRQIIRLNPRDPYVHISLADFYRKNGKPSKSFDELKKGFANPKLDTKTKINLLLTYYSGQLTDDQKAQALELAEVIKSAHPKDSVADAFYASMLYENKKYKEARPLFREMLVNNQDNYSYWEQLLFCDLYLNDNKTLEADATVATKHFPEKPIPYFLGGIASFQLKNYKKAKTFLEKSKEMAYGNNALLENINSTLGDTYHELKENEAAYKAYDEVLHLNSENTIVLNNYAYYLALDGVRLDKAASLAKKAVDLDPYNQNNLDTYAWVLYKQKKYEQALKWEQKALDNGGKTSGVVVEHYGDILYRLGKHKEALVQWKKAAGLKDHSKLLKKKIKTGKLYE